MMLLAQMPDVAPSPAQFQLVLACVLGALGFFYLLPRPHGRHILWGTFLSLSSLIAGSAFVFLAFGNPTPDLIGNILFGMFSAGAIGFGAVLVTQSNPARGAIAFAFVILSSCGLFLLLAAPFLMAATVIIYAGAIIVTFLFVLMLSHADGPSAENDRTRDPLLGSLAGFAFAGLVLFTLYVGANQSASASTLPLAPLTAIERSTLTEVDAELRQAIAATDRDEFLKVTKPTRDKLAEVVGPIEAGKTARSTLQERLRVAVANPRTQLVIRSANALRDKNQTTFDAVDNKLVAGDLNGAKAALQDLRNDVVILGGQGHIPARNVGTLGLVLYSEHLISVELAGTLLLVATIGSMVIAAGRKGTAA